MYEGWKKRGALSSEWVAKTDAFLDRAFARSETGTDVRCPCSKCRNINYIDGGLPLSFVPLLKGTGETVGLSRSTTTAVMVMCAWLSEW
jgi:hypothetical protein